MLRRTIPLSLRLPRRLSPSPSPSSLYLFQYASGGTSSSAAAAAAASLPPPNLSKVLVANRGEIACRVLRTCRRLGIPTVAVYSSADGPHCLHAQMADEAYLIGTGPTASECYLRGEDLLEIALRTQADAIHPGYGFLSENAQFASAVVAASTTDHDGNAHSNIRWVGPPASAMTAMASKSQAKAIMEAAGVPTTPGYYHHTDRSSSSSSSSSSSITTTTLDQHDAQFLYEQAVHHVGFPLIIKAVMGGGGKGMRLVHGESEFMAALQSCQRESQASFGNDSVLLERYLIRPRHVEVQIVADQHGNVLHLHERDCSMQRRHQKIIEEGPASDLSTELRIALGTMATRAASAVGYVNAGTVEFLLDTTRKMPNSSSSSSKNDNDYGIYFCEMNTRLQVEHPVTEYITNIDLVEWQLRIAAGEVLPILNQADIPCLGHAMEARVYAENPTRNFLPAVGTVWHHRPLVPVNSNEGHNSSIRVDTGLQSGQAVSVYYDPMIAKVIAHGATREQARTRLVQALKGYQIAGVATNIDFLIACAQHPTFRIAGATTTSFLEDHADDIRSTLDRHNTPPLARVAGALAMLLKMENRILAATTTTTTNTGVGVSKAPWSSHWGSWRMGSERPHRKLVMHNHNITRSDNNDDDEGSTTTTVTCTSNRDGSFDLSWSENDNNDDDDDGTFSFHVNGSLTANGNMTMVVNQSQRISLTTVWKEEDDGLLKIRMWPESVKEDYYWEIDAVDPMSPLAVVAMHSDNAAATADGQSRVKAPMPGKISRINNNLAVGDFVKAGEVVIVMEAMKMEHACSSPCSGILSEIRCQPNDIVNDGAVLFVVTVDKPRQMNLQK